MATKAAKIEKGTNGFNHRSPGDMVIQVILYIITAIAALVCVLPFLYVFGSSFATEREILTRPFFIIPREFSLNAYTYIVKDGAVFKGLRNSLLVTVVGTAINMFVSCTMAYPLSRKYLRGRNFFMNMVIIIMLFGGGMVPSYVLIASVLKLRNTYWALWLPGAMSAFNMIIIKNYFQGIPDDLEEAAIIDGANDLYIFLRVMLPLSAPVLAAVSLFYAVGHWNAYFGAMMYITDPNMEVVQIVLRRIIFLTGSLVDDGTINWGPSGSPPTKAVRMATTVVATVPILVVYPFIQKYFTAGVMVGSVKG